MLKRALVAVAAVVLLLSVSDGASAADKTQGVYVKFFEAMKADISGTAEKVGTALKDAGFEVLATFENGMPEGCKFRAVTIVFTRADYAVKVLAGGPDKGFALPLRLALYEDEKGLNLAVVNPVSINRTIFQGGSTDVHAEAVLADVEKALKTVGPTVHKQIGELRQTGEISGIGGGAFPDKVITVASSTKPVSEAAAAVKGGFSDKSGWHSIYSYSPSPTMTIVGVTNLKTEARAYGIAGEKRAESNYKFPGIDHAAAFPIEILVHGSDGSKAIILKEMWRMKLYFQDAGNWAFMKNMGMPGQIEEEIMEGIKKSLK